MKRTLHLIIATVLVALLLTGFTYQSQRPQWEYKVSFSPKDFDGLGTQGWEMVSVAVEPQSGIKTYYFKRQR
jgi:hypothetical protein